MFTLDDNDMSMGVHQLLHMPHLVGDVENGGGCSHGEQGGTWEISVPSTQFCYEPRTTLKNKVYSKGKKKKQVPDIQSNCKT